MTALRVVATATAQVLRMVADVIDPEPAYGEPRAFVFTLDGREIGRATRGVGHG